VIIQKLLSGSSSRRTRLHDEKGNFVGWKRLALHGPGAVAGGLLRVATGFRPRAPWIGLSAIRLLRDNLNARSSVLEFGSGMSTLWYAKHAGSVYSVEDNRDWFQRVELVLHRRRITNVSYHYATGAEYAAIVSGTALQFDLVMVDGSYRSECIRHSINHVKPGGIMYLDNSDKDPDVVIGDMRLAERLLAEAAASRGGRLQYMTDFAPCEFFVQQGLMLRLP
jgi:hypothetical protein